MAIDDPAAKLLRDALDPGEHPIDNALKFLSIVPVVGPAFALTAFVKQAFSGDQVGERLRLLYESIQERLDEHQVEIDTVKVTLEQHRELEEGLHVAMREAALAQPPDAIRNMGHIVASQAAEPRIEWDDFPTLVGDVVRLSNRDLAVLGVLWKAQRGVELPGDRVRPDMDEANRARGEVIDRGRAAGFDVESLEAHCLRLSGFGLTASVERNNSLTAPGDSVFRVTTRGLRLLRLLDPPLGK